MPRYEFSEGSSNKFWEIKLDGKSFTTTYGKIGTGGQTTVKTEASPAEAKKQYEKLIAEKTKKGYTLVGGGGRAASDDDEDDDGDDEDEAPAKKKVIAKPAAKVAAKVAAKPAPKAAAKPAAKKAGGSTTKRYFEFSEGSSNKFWEVWTEGTSLMTKYGKIGASGAQTVKDFGSDDKLAKEYEKIVNEKTKKGYEETERSDSGGDDDDDGDDD